MLYVNANHAICDGRSLMHFLGCASNALPAQQFAKKWRELGPLPDWKEMVASAKLERWGEDPPYLCSKNQILNIKELCLEHESKGDECLRFDLSNASLQSLRQRLRMEAEGATLTGLLIAVFMRCLVVEYTGSEARDLAVSVLVDLRGRNQTCFSSFDPICLQSCHGLNIWYLKICMDLSYGKQPNIQKGGETRFWSCFPEPPGLAIMKTCQAGLSGKLMCDLICFEFGPQRCLPNPTHCLLSLPKANFGNDFDLRLPPRPQKFSSFAKA